MEGLNLNPFIFLIPLIAIWWANSCLLNDEDEENYF